MALIEWQEHFELGIPEIDHEHREMITLINELYAHLGNADDSERVLDFLGEVYAKISAHFALEERDMRNLGYDEYEDHKADHEKLLDELRDIMDAYEDNETFDDGALSNALTNWFTDHFSTRDARLHACLGPGPE